MVTCRPSSAIITTQFGVAVPPGCGVVDGTAVALGRGVLVGAVVGALVAVRVAVGAKVGVALGTGVLPPVTGGSLLK